MKLTKADREAFVAAVMDDVPVIDYDTPAEKRAQELYAAACPAPIQAIYADKKLRRFLDTAYRWLPGSLNNCYVLNLSDERAVDLANDPELLALDAKKTTQSQTIARLRGDVTGVINSCTTLKQAKERLPEFERYLPADRDGSGLSNLPAIANVVAGLTKAGWPKGQERTAA